MKPAIILVPFVLLLYIVSADVLQNPNFELPPSTWAPNSTVPSVSLNENNTIPGWTAQGTVEYYLSNLTPSLPPNQHAILLAADGKINQTFVATGEVKQFLLAFTLALGSPSPGPLKCLASKGLVISVPGSDLEFPMKPNNGEDRFDIFGVHLGSWGNGELINLLIQSQNTGPSSNSTCWPVVDNVDVEAGDQSRQSNGDGHISKSLNKCIFAALLLLTLL